MQTVVASYARADLIELTGVRLRDNVGIREHGARHAHDVRVALLENRFRRFDVTHPPGIDERDVQRRAVAARQLGPLGEPVMMRLQVARCAPVVAHHAVGGQVRIAARAKENAAFAQLIEFQTRRLERAGVDVALGKDADAAAVLAFGVDVVAIATGSRGRIPAIEGVHAPFVLEGREVMTGAETGERVTVIAQEDHMQPLTIAGHLVDQGKQVQLVYQTPGIAPVVGKYSIGAPLAKFTAGGGTVRMMERVVEITRGCLHTRNVYSGVAGTVEGFDTVVLACGGEANSGLYEELLGKVENLHVLGDAYAPRRIWFATRQAYELAERI